MPRAYSPETIELVERLLSAAAPLSHRQIAILTDVGRSTVDSVAAGRYRKKAVNREESGPRSRSGDSDEIEYPDMRAAKVWCQTCQARVQPPCLACQVRALKKAERIDRIKSRQRRAA